MLNPKMKIGAILIGFVLVFSSLLIYWQTRSFEFINYDDDVYVSANQQVLNGLTYDGLTWAFTTNTSNHWHPLTWLSLMFTSELFGSRPGTFHMTNVFFHIANTLLLFWILKTITGNLWCSAFAASLFAVHPMHVESVAWISSQKDVISCFFLLLSLAAYSQYVKHRTIFRYISVLVLFSLGLMSKPIVMTLPFLFLLLDFWPFERIKNFDKHLIFKLILEKLPFFILSAISSIVTFVVMKNGGMMIKSDRIPFSERILNVFVSYVIYIGKMFWPVNLAPFYPYNPKIESWQIFISALSLIIILVLVILYGRVYKFLPVGFLWFIGALIPVIGIIQVGAQAYADRYTYISYIGLFIIIAWLMPVVFPKLAFIMSSIMIISVIAFGAISYRQASYWKNSLTLFSHTIEVTSNNWLAYNNISNAYADKGRYTDAVVACKKAIEIKPFYDTAFYNLGRNLSDLNRFAEAEEAYKQSININPANADAYLGLGYTYDNLGRHNEAIDAYKQCIKIKSTYAEAYYNLGYSYLILNDKKSALEQYNVLVSLKSQYADKLYKTINEN